MPKRPSLDPMPDVDSLIATVRGQKVLLDSDLARIYGVPTFRFNEAVKRNQQRFPADFRFQLTAEEWAAVQAFRSQNVVLRADPNPNSSQIAMSSARHRGATYRPWAFTEHGAMMAANILNSDRTVEMSVYGR
jgi:ORF6N domain